MKTDPSQLSGADWQAGRFARGLRTSLLAQHLGWSKEDAEGTYADPVSVQTLDEIRRVAKENTRIYDALFEVVPTDQVRTWDQLACRRERANWTSGDVTRTPTEAEARKALARVQGHLVEFPLDFLIHEDLVPSAISKALNPTVWAPDAFN